MVNLVVLLVETDRAEAGVWFRTAAEAGHVSAMFNFGILLKQQGRLDEAEDLYRQAAEAGHHSAMLNLSFLLAERGRSKELQAWSVIQMWVHQWSR
ncbi:MAG TPA: tetratricopeptide repeat protein [Pyrinomonadaceae bacterium]|nr:tetratricopeptide repeat protein [Pyrinomonadaceae bacterium]